MNQKLFLIVALALGLAACTTTPAENELIGPVESAEEQIKIGVDEVNNQISILEESLLERFNEVCRDKEADIRKQLAASQKKLRESRSNLKSIKGRCDDIVSSKKMVLGEIEDIVLLDHDAEFEARIDTGAETSSLGVYKLMQFERDGKDWVKFALESGRKAEIYEYPVHDNVRIKQREAAGTEARLEIELDIQVGKKEYRKQLFNLADRNHYDYQVLIGRSFLRDIAVVDVGTKHQLKRK